MYVTSDNAGGDQLRAFRELASTWGMYRRVFHRVRVYLNHLVEYFAFESVGGCKYTLRMTINGKLVGVRGDGTLYADQTAVGASTVFSVVGSGCPA